MPVTEPGGGAVEIRVSSPGHQLDQDDINRVTRDLEKIQRRLSRHQEVFAEVRIQNGSGASPGHLVTLEVEYGRNHLIAKAEHADIGRAVREAREEILRQINDRSRKGHSWFAKRR
jgi:ribosome-associated translation inhibitor RaiA